MNKVYILTVSIDTDGHFSFGLEHPFVKAGFRRWDIQCGWTEESVARTQAVKILDGLRVSVTPSHLGQCDAEAVKRFLRKASRDIKLTGNTERYREGGWDGSVTFGEVPILQ